MRSSKSWTIDQLTLPGVDINIFKIDQIYEQKTESFAFYGDVVWDVLDDLELEAGARYNWEHKSIDADVTVQNQPLCLDSPIRPGPLVCQDGQTFDHPTGLVKLRYSLSESTSISAKYTHGWKSQQYNVRDGQTQLGAIDRREPREDRCLRVGLQQRTGSRNASSLQGALFWYDYQDYQVFTFSNELGTPPQRIVINANDAQLYGAELETTIGADRTADRRPPIRLAREQVPGFHRDLAAGGSRSNPNAPPRSSRSPSITTGTDSRTRLVSRSASSAEYTLDMGRLGGSCPATTSAWTDDIFFDQTEGRGTPGIGRQFPAGLHDRTEGLCAPQIRLSYRPPGEQLEIAGWVRNLTNELYKTTAFNASEGVRLVGNLVGDPRIYGISVFVQVLRSGMPRAIGFRDALAPTRIRRSIDLVTEGPELIQLHLVELDLGRRHAPGRRRAREVVLDEATHLVGDLGLIGEDVSDLLGIRRTLEELLLELSLTGARRDEAVALVDDRDDRHLEIDGLSPAALDVREDRNRSRRLSAAGRSQDLGQKRTPVRIRERRQAEQIEDRRPDVDPRRPRLDLETRAAA